MVGVLDKILRNAVSEKNDKSIKENMDDICGLLESEIINSDSDDDTKKEMLKKLRKFCSTQTNIMLVGATGCGKSSTINALFGCGELITSEEVEEYIEVAKVGSKADPETKDIEKYTIGKLTLWDTPGLGDGTKIDEHHKEVIRELLREEDKDGNALIDLVLVILDGSTKDLGTSYKILNDVIIPELGEETGRILVALNQADIAMKTGRHWDYENNEPDETLVQFLEEKIESITARIKEDSNLDVEPIYYCAGYKEEGGEVVHPYNLSKLLYYILDAIPSHKRIAIMESVNTNSENYEYNDDDMDYGEAVKDSFMDSFDDFISEGVYRGGEIGGTILGIPGAVVGMLIGGTIGCIRSILNEIF
ncbi:MAG: 50S ribosome-binding GTPase [Lachnospiraceae bacterium]|nr:50S ribosome-binding GTPase [Lachnospiraceae bacterium]